MLVDYKLGQTSVVLRVVLYDSSSTTQGRLTGLSSSSTGLVISAIADNEATTTAYSVASSNVETIATLGTYAAPTSGKCRFMEVDSTNHPGLYEIQLADARFAVTSAKSLVVTIRGATNLAQCDVLVPLRQVDPYEGRNFGLTCLPTASPGQSGGVARKTEVDNASANVWNQSTSNYTSNVGSMGKWVLDYLNAAVSSRLADADYADPPTAAAIADAVWDEAQSGHTTSGTFGKYLDAQVSAVSSVSAATIADAVWDEARSGHTTSGSFGEALQTKDGDITAAASTTVTLPSPYNTAAYQGRQIVCGGQVRILSSLSTGVWTLDAAWSSVPSAGTAFLLGLKPGGATAADVWSHPNRVITASAGAIDINLNQTGYVPRDLTAVADSALTTGDMLVAAYAGGLVGDRSISSTTLTVRTASTNTVVATKTLDSPTAPTSAS